MENNLSLEVVWMDDDLLEVKVSICCNGFSGFTEVYTTDLHLEECANSIEGFPKNIKDHVEMNFGAKGDNPSAFLDFYCYSGAGGTLVYVDLETDSNSYGTPKKHDKRQVVVDMRFEAQAISRFVAGLRNMANNKAGKARLLGFRHST